MSAMAVGVGNNGIILAADGVCSDLDGRVMGWASKIITWPQRNAAIAWCGIGNFGHLVSLEVSQTHPTFDELVDDFPEICRWVYDDLALEDRRMWQDEAYRKVSVVLAGYSEARNKFEAYRIVSYAKGSTNAATGETTALEPWTMVPIDYLFCSHAPSQAVAEEFGLDTEENIADLCIRYICANRAESGYVEQEIDGSGGGHYNVGGFVQVVFISAGPQQSWIAHRWPEDVPGAPIDPTKGQKLPDYLMPQHDE